MLTFLVILPSNAFAQDTLHDRTLYEAVKQTSGLRDNSKIDVGKTPVAIGVEPLEELVYVVNKDSNTLSVISSLNNTKIKDITVGEFPAAIGVDVANKAVYIANSGSNTVSVIDGTANKVVAGITFQINPLNSGYILCDGLTIPSPTEQYVYVYYDDECIAKPNKGFEFVSWEENLGANSTQLIKAAHSLVPLDSIADFFGLKSDKPEATLSITKFGTFTANFRELPPPIPPEFWLQLLGFVGSAIIGWSIPSIVAWVRSRRETGKLNYYHK